MPINTPINQSANGGITASGTGSHRFYTTDAVTERMRIYNNGAVGIQGVGNWAITQGMTAGSLTIGNITQNYGGQSGAVANMAGLMFECLDNTEFGILDADQAIHSFMRYTTNGNFRIGRDMGWGIANTTFTGTLTCDSTSTLTGRVGIGKAPHATYALDVNGTLNATTIFVGGTAITGGSKWTNNTADATKIY